MSKKNHVFGDARSTKHSDIQIGPRRVASRMEGVVKNSGIKQGKKPPKSKN